MIQESPIARQIDYLWKGRWMDASKGIRGIHPGERLSED
jgi:hypothetical protein